MSVTGRFGCCCGGCGFLGAHIRRTFPGWRKPLPEDFGEWIIDGSSSVPEVEDWVGRHGAYDLDYVPWFTNPEDWGPQCAKYNPIRFMGVQVNATGTYVNDGSVVNWSYVYEALRKKEIWYTDSLGRTGLKTEVYNIVGQDPPLYAATRNEETGDWEQDGTNPDIIDLYNNQRPPRGLDVYAALANPLGGTARLLIEETTHNDLDAIRIVKEITDPVTLGSLTVVQIYKQEIILYQPWTFAEFENWLGTIFDAVKLDDPMHVYPAATFFAGNYDPFGNIITNTEPITLPYWNQRYEPFYSSQENSWPNRVLINLNLSHLWFESAWMRVAALRHTDGTGLQLVRGMFKTTSPACLISYEFEPEPEDFVAGLAYNDTCTPPAFGKTGDYILECDVHPAGTHVFTSADIAYSHGILFVGVKELGIPPIGDGGLQQSPIQQAQLPCWKYGTPLAGIPPDEWWLYGGTTVPTEVSDGVFLEERDEITACCFPVFPAP